MTVPIGTILPYGGLVDGKPRGVLDRQGWLVCNGEEISRDDYSELYEVIGGFFGYGDNVKTFNLPDLRGRFVRGVDGGTGRDPDANSRVASADGGNAGDKVGSIQEDAFKTHEITYEVRHATDWGAAGRDYPGLAGYPRKETHKKILKVDGGADETRPKNIYVNWIIKAKNV